MRATKAWAKFLSGLTGDKVKAAVSKFGNIRTLTLDGNRHDSKREAKRWMQLVLLLNAGRIRNLRRQVNYPIEVNGQRVCTYRADHVYEELNAGVWTEIVEDAKGYRTPSYKLKKTLMRVVLGIQIREA